MPARLKSIIVRPTPPVVVTGRRKTVWRRLKLTEDSAAWLPEQKNQGSKQLVSSSPASCWELGESSGAGAPLEPPSSLRWQTVRKRYWWRNGGSLQEDGSGKTRRAAQDAARGHTMDSREFFKKRLVGCCFRCLDVDHQVAQCRDPVRCLRCKGFGHISRHCRSGRRQPISTKLRSRLTFPAGSIHSRLIFPPLCSANYLITPPSQNTPNNSTHPPPKVGETEYVPGQVADRPTLGRVAIVPWCGRCQAPAAPSLYEHDKDDDFERLRRCNKRRRSRSPLRSTPHFSDPLTDHGCWSPIPRSPPLRYDDLMFCRAPPEHRAPRDDDNDDDFRKPPHRGDVPKSTRFRQLSPNFSSKCAVHGDQAPMERGVPAAAHHGGLCVGGRPSHTPWRTGSAGARAPQLPEPTKDVRASLHW